MSSSHRGTEYSWQQSHTILFRDIMMQIKGIASILESQLLVIWSSMKSKKQSIISKSSSEAEYHSLASTIGEVTWIIGLFKTLDIPLTLHIPLHCNNKTTIQIAAIPVFHERTKHIDIDCQFIREKILHGLVNIQYLCSSEKPADILTKSLGRLQHSHNCIQYRNEKYLHIT